MQGLVAVDTGHLDVENDHIRFCGQLVQCLFAAAGDKRLESLPVQDFLSGGPKLGLVVNH